MMRFKNFFTQVRKKGTKNLFCASYKSTFVGFFVGTFFLHLTTTAFGYTPLAYLKKDTAGTEQVGWLYWQQIRDNKPISFLINNAGTPDVQISIDDPAIDEFEAMTLAFETWQEKSGTNLQFTLGRTDIKSIGYDGQNVIFFENLGDVGYGGAAFITYDNTTGQILDADIHMNDYKIKWLTSLNDASGEPLPCPCQGSDSTAIYTNDIQGMTTHEIGHALGMDHSAIGFREFVGTPTMYPRGIWNVPNDGSRPADSRYRTIELDDVIGFKNLYPNVAQTYTTGAIQGVVHDLYDAKLFGAHVIAKNLTTGVEVGAMTGVLPGDYRSDAYQLRGLPPGQYQLRVESISGFPPGYVSRYNFGGIASSLVPLKFPQTVDLPVMYYPLAYDSSQASSLSLAEKDVTIIDFRPIVAMRKLSKFIRVPAPFYLTGHLNTDVTGALLASSFIYTVNGGSPVVQSLPLTNTPFSIFMPAFPAGSLIQFSINLETQTGKTFQSYPVKFQVGLSGEPLITVSEHSGRISIVDTKTMFQIDEAANSLSYPLGQAFHRQKFGEYITNFGNDTVTFIPFFNNNFPTTHPSSFDSDGDGLLDELESKFGTDMNNPDTDGDYALDGDEISELSYIDPLAGTSYFEAIGGTADAKGDVFLGDPYVEIAIWNVTENRWQSTVLMLTTSGRYKLRLPAGVIFKIYYYDKTTHVFLKDSKEFTGGAGEIVSVGIIKTSDAPSQPVLDTGTSPLDFVSAPGLLLSPTSVIQFASGTNPWTAVLKPTDQRYLYVAANGTNQVYKIDTVTDKIVGQTTVGLAPKGITLTPDGKKLYVTNTGSKSISVLDADALSLIATVPVTGSPNEISMAPDGSSVMVASSGSTTDINLIDTSHDTLIKSISSGIAGGLYFLSAADELNHQTLAGPFYSSSHHLSLIDTNSETSRRIDLGSTVNATSGVALHPDGARGYAIHYYGYELLEFELEKGVILRRMSFSPADIRNIFLLQLQYEVNTSSSSGGAIVPSGKVLVNYDSNQTFGITANPGFYVKDVSVDGFSIGAVTSYSFNNIKSNHTIAVNFVATNDCVGDLNLDRKIDLKDLGILLASLSEPTQNNSADLNGDGLIDTADLGILLANYGRSC